MTSQKTIQRCRERVVNLENEIVELRLEISKLKSERNDLKRKSKLDDDIIDTVRKEKENCKTKCDIIVKEKDRAISERDRRLANIQNARQYINEMAWTKDIKSESGADVVIIFTGKHP